MTDTASSLVDESSDQGWEHFTPHLPEVIDDPYPAFRWLREHAPAFHVVSEDIWVLSRYDDVVAAARDPLTYSQTESVGYSRHRGKGTRPHRPRPAGPHRAAPAHRTDLLAPVGLHPPGRRRRAARRAARRRPSTPPSR